MKRCLILLGAVLLGCGRVASLPAQVIGGQTIAAPPPLETSGDLPASLRRSHELEGNDPQKAFQYALEALHVGRGSRDPARTLEALLQAARTARGVAEYTQADELASEGLALAARLGNEGARGDSLVARGMVKWNLADLPAAMGSFLEARAIADKLDRDDLRIGAESGLGLAYGWGEHHDEALVHLEEARRLAEQKQDPRLPSVLNYLGNNYLLAKDCAHAREHL